MSDDDLKARMDQIVNIPTNWTFKDESVAQGFEQHVREQLPWYDMVTEAIVQIGRHYISQDSRVYDIGASTGNIGRALAPVIRDRSAILESVEESEEMAQKWHEWAHWQSDQGITIPGPLHIVRAQDHEYRPFSFAVSMLCLMFLRPADQDALLDKLMKQCAAGGALVVVERMMPPNGYLSIVTSRLTLAAKLAAGVRPDQIIAKELSLAGVQRPLRPGLMLEHRATEWFRYGDFAGWIIEGAGNG